MPKKHPEHVNLERWLVSYADFITLLFAFFTVMYALSKSDVAKFKSMAESIRAAFSADFADQAGKSGGGKLNQFSEPLPVGGLAFDMPAGRSNVRAPDYEELKRLAEILEESISLELGASDYAEKMQLEYDDRGLVVRLSAKDFFAPGQVAVRSDALPILDRVAATLKQFKRHVRVEGHTDNSKEDSKGFPSQWELSTARASWIVRYFIKKYSFDPQYLEVAGRAQFQPVASNDTAAGRAKNRRVEIIVLGKDPK